MIFEVRQWKIQNVFSGLAGERDQITNCDQETASRARLINRRTKKPTSQTRGNRQSINRFLRLLVAERQIWYWSMIGRGSIGARICNLRKFGCKSTLKIVIVFWYCVLVLRIYLRMLARKLSVQKSPPLRDRFLSLCIFFVFSLTALLAF